MKANQVIFGLVASMMVAVTAPAFAADGVVKEDGQKVQQDKADVAKDKQDIKTAKDAIATDKANGNQEQLKKDKKALHEARRNKKQDKARLHQDKAEEKHDQKNP